MKDINTVRLSGTIFWSKLDERQSFSMLRVGLKLASGDGVFCTINNPKIKEYELVKPGNKLLIVNAWFDTWAERDELQIKTYDSGTQLFKRDTVLPDINEVTIVGTVVAYEGEHARIEMIGERNPKTGKWSKRVATVKIGDKYDNIEGNRILIQGKVASVTTDGKTKAIIESSYDKINIF